MLSPHVPLAGPVLDADAELFREQFDRTAFVFRHRLAGDPLFAPDRILDLAKRMARDPADVYYDAGKVEIGQRWDETPVCDIPVDHLLQRIETADAWIVLRRAEKFPEYADLLDRCIAEIEALAGRDLRRVMKLRNAIIFINSPHRVSTYHIDRECNFLLQIRGRKTISAFDRRDRDVLPLEEIERFWAVDNNAATYKPEFADRAMVVELTPGSAIHLPVNAPHWVANGPDVSVSLSINFHYHDALLADVYRGNYWLRRAGLNPKPPGASPKLDAVAAQVYGSSRTFLRAAQRIRARFPARHG
jgi:hypothetical protein